MKTTKTKYFSSFIVFHWFAQVVYNVDEETNLADKSALELFVPKDTDLYINNKKEKHVFGFV